MYEIRIEPAHNLIDATLGGLMTDDEATDYIAALKREFVAHGLQRYVMVIDITHCPIQTQDFIRTMGSHMASMPKASALAIVTGSSLARMQARRLFTQPYARIVATMAEARAWVLHATEARAA